MWVLLRHCFLILFLGGLILWSQHAVARVLINEIMWAGSDRSTSDEWVEITSTEDATSSGTSLAGWTLASRNSQGIDEVFFTFPHGAQIGSGEFLLVSNFDEAGSTLAVVPDYVVPAISLVNSKLFLTLRSADGILQDEVDDWIGAPFAGRSGTEKASMERVSLTLLGNLPELWQTAFTALGFDAGVVQYGTPGFPNASVPDTTPPADATYLSAHLTESSSGRVLTVTWTVSPDPDLTLQEITVLSPPGVLSGAILPNTATGFILENVSATGVLLRHISIDASGNRSSGVNVSANAAMELPVEDEPVPVAVTGSVLPMRVLVNEVYASVRTGEAAWIEILNAGSGSVTLDAWKLKVGTRTVALTSFNRIDPGAFILISPTDLGFSPSTLGSTVSILSGALVLDSLEYPKLPKGVSYGRYHDGSLLPFCLPTQGTPNDAQVSGLQIDLQSGRTTGVDHLALNVQATLLRGTLESARCSWDYGDGTLADRCNPGSHTYDDVGSYSLNLEVVEYCGNTLTQSLSVTVLPSGGSEKGESSSAMVEPSLTADCTPTTGTGVVLSELLPSPESGGQEWIELGNTTGQEISLCGWSIGDAKKTFLLDDFRLPARGYLLLDGKVTGITLNNDADLIRLIPPSSLSAKAEEVSYAQARQGSTYAKRPDGYFSWTDLPTPGQPNALPSQGLRTGTSAFILYAVLPNPLGKDEGNEWIDLKNTLSQVASLDGWSLQTSGGTKKALKDGGIIDPGALYRLFPKELGLTLRNTEEELTLLSPEGMGVSVLKWSDAREGSIHYQPLRKTNSMSTYVVRVIDGDTIVTERRGSGSVTEGPERETVRLIGVDAPEINSEDSKEKSFGLKAKEFLRSLVIGKEVVLQNDTDTDAYGRLLAYVFTQEGASLQAELLINGFVRVYDRFPFEKMAEYRALEQEAKNLKSGLWAGEGGENPDEELPLEIQQNCEGTLILTEIFAHPSSSDTQGEWIELYNPTDAPVDLSGWILDDLRGSGSKEHRLAEHVVQPGGMNLIFQLESGLKLNDTGEEVSIISPCGDLMDTVKLPSVKEGIAYARSEDSWCLTQSPTPGADNVCAAPASAAKAASKKASTKKPAAKGALPIRYSNVIGEQLASDSGAQLQSTYAALTQLAPPAWGGGELVLPDIPNTRNWIALVTLTFGYAAGWSTPFFLTWYHASQTSTRL
ncbi:MAG: lamin tail domain-containing protein [Candidatus Peregrinibacteria bacterium]|nr:lamin tail domain-containing protein [Candidatus Peregrinibacteria bacterium]